MLYVACLVACCRCTLHIIMNRCCSVSNSPCDLPRRRITAMGAAATGAPPSRPPALPPSLPPSLPPARPPARPPAFPPASCYPVPCPFGRARLGVMPCHAMPCHASVRAPLRLRHDVIVNRAALQHAHVGRPVLTGFAAAAALIISCAEEGRFGWFLQAWMHLQPCVEQLYVRQHHAATTSTLVRPSASCPNRVLRARSRPVRQVPEKFPKHHVYAASALSRHGPLPVTHAKPRKEYEYSQV
jgi:hypothetical protein